MIVETKDMNMIVNGREAEVKRGGLVVERERWCGEERECERKEGYLTCSKYSESRGLKRRKNKQKEEE